ncbi:exported hypothetical protein [Desulfosarcina cetonica]|nr:exported hypothetical protein [Desulfosarcina cetonica]
MPPWKQRPTVFRSSLLCYFFPHFFALTAASRPLPMVACASLPVDLHCMVEPDVYLIAYQTLP